MDKYLFFNNSDTTTAISSNTVCGAFPLSRLKSVHPNGVDTVRLSFEPSQNQFFDGSSTTDTAIGDVDYVDLTIPNDTTAADVNTMTDTIRDLFRKIQSVPAGSLITVYDARNTTENIINVSAVLITRQSANN
tara:strand:+ start:76 stop:474 length:399 start_codon:yes stop_codon:yes gene_type:complete